MRGSGREDGGRFHFKDNLKGIEGKRGRKKVDWLGEREEEGGIKGLRLGSQMKGATDLSLKETPLLRGFGFLSEENLLEIEPEIIPQSVPQSPVFESLLNDATYACVYYNPMCMQVLSYRCIIL